MADELEDVLFYLTRSDDERAESFWDMTKEKAAQNWNRMQNSLQGKCRREDMMKRAGSSVAHWKLCLKGKKEPVLLNRMGFDQQNSPAMTKLRDNGIWDYSGNSTPSSNSLSAV